MGNKKQYITVLDSEIEIAYDAFSEALSISATHSKKFPPTYTENWLSEPLRILFGQLIYPRLVARNLDERRSHVFLRRTHAVTSKGSWVALLHHRDALRETFDLWPWYAELLRLIARARDREGNPNFEAHQITRVYEEIILATSGTRWVWALTLASSIEGMVYMLGGVGESRADVTEASRKSLVDYIAKSASDERLKWSAINAVSRAAKITSVDRLRTLVATKVLTSTQFDAWNEIRNSVMRSLISPYPTEEEDRELLSLVEMMHAMTLEILRSSASIRPIAS